MTDDRINEILGKLTLEQKASLCSGSSFWLTEPIPEAGVPAVRVSDGPNGVRKEKTSAGTNVMKAAETATCYPTLATLACSWDEDLAEEVGAAIGEEAANLGVSTILGPGVNIKRSPLCGRNFEYFSEDPLLAGRLGAAYVKGLKSKGVGCSVKHFCANNQETLRMSIDTVVDERALREIYLPAFEHIVKTQKPRTVMCSYNRLGGTYLSDNKRLLNDILRGEWGFDGIVVSDWGAVNDRVEGIKAGLDLEMPGCNGVTDREIVKAVRSGAVSEEELDAVARRMLGFIFESVEALPKPGVTDFDKQNAVAAKAAAQSAVLLKNDGAALPLAENANVAVIGAMAKHIRYQGGGSSHINTPYTVSFCDAMRAAGKSFAYADGYDIKTDIPSPTLIKEACDRARGRDAVILFIGLTDSYETEGKDRRHLDIPLSHVLLLDAL
ncbi:MAG: glycoside hydrolase family 3 protein, partial [Clostridia bacterium]|nr:glycoside hydrolase family 3 protein [Clostridia bacterium]